MYSLSRKPQHCLGSCFANDVNNWRPFSENVVGWKRLGAFYVATEGRGSPRFWRKRSTSVVVSCEDSSVDCSQKNTCEEWLGSQSPEL